MPLSPSLVWEIRTTGNDLNSGAFRAGAPGTDYSQQNAPQVVFTDLTIGAADATKVSSAANPFAADHIGNTLRISGGTGFTAGVYEVVSVASGVATLDRAAGTVGAAGGSGRLGGALASLTALAAVMASSNKAWVQAGTYNEPGAITFSGNGATPKPTVPATHIIGYDQVRGDLRPDTPNPNRPLIQSASTGNALNITGNGFRIENLAATFSVSNTTNRLFSIGGGSNVVLGCKAIGPALDGFYSTAQLVLFDHCEAVGDFGDAGIRLTQPYSRVRHCYVHDNTIGGHGIAGNGNTFGYSFDRNIVANLGGTGANGIILGIWSQALHNTVHNCSNHGITVPNDNLFEVQALGNLLTNNGGFGLNCFAAGMPACPQFDGNAYFGNTGGTRQNLDDAGTVNPVNASGPYTNTRDVILTADPYVNAANGDFRLNNTAGGGAACRGAAPGSAWPGAAMTGYGDMGAVQHQEQSINNIISWLEG